MFPVDLHADFKIKNLHLHVIYCIMAYFLLQFQKFQKDIS